MLNFISGLDRNSVLVIYIDQVQSICDIVVFANHLSVLANSSYLDHFRYGCKTVFLSVRERIQRPSDMQAALSRALRRPNRRVPERPKDVKATGRARFFARRSRDFLTISREFRFSLCLYFLFFRIMRDFSRNPGRTESARRCANRDYIDGRFARTAKAASTRMKTNSPLGYF